MTTRSFPGGFGSLQGFFKGMAVIGCHIAKVDGDMAKVRYKIIETRILFLSLSGTLQVTALPFLYVCLFPKPRMLL